MFKPIIITKLSMKEIHHDVLQFVYGTRNLWRQEHCWIQKGVVNSDLPRNIKATVCYKNEHTNSIISKLDMTPKECRENLKHIYIFTVKDEYRESLLTLPLL